MNHYRHAWSLFALVLIFVSACSAGTLDITVETATPVSTSVQSVPGPTLPGTATYTPPPEATPQDPATPAPVSSATPPVWETHTYHNAAQGITFEYPAVYDERHDFNCAPETQESAEGVTISFVNSDTPSLLLLGGTQGGAWLDAPRTAALLDGGMPYQLYVPTGFLGTTHSTTPAHTSPTCPGMYSLTVDPVPASGSVTGLAGGWNAMPRIPEPLPNDTEAYRQAIANLLDSNGLAGIDVTLTQVLRVDLEGDGNDEVLISASRFAETPGPIAVRGDYSLVVLRTVVNNEVVTVPLRADYYLQAEELFFPLTYTVGGVLDLNGDGRMEVGVDVSYWEGNDVMVYEVAQGQAQPVLSTGCQ
jgi:hypothetical protein